MAIEIKNLFEESSPDRIFYPITSGEAVNVNVGGETKTLQDYIDTLVSINTSVTTDEGTLVTKFCSFPNTYTKDDVLAEKNASWENNPPTQLSAERPNLWKKYRTEFLEKEPTSWIYELCGLMGPLGAQGEGPKSLTIYCINNTLPATPISVDSDNNVPFGWREYPQAGTNQKQWVSFRHKDDDGHWGAYSTPELWGIDIEGIKLDLQDSIADVQKEISDLMEESEKTLKGYEDRINLILSSEIPRIETEVRNAVAEANNKAAEAANYLQESKIGEVVSKVLDDPTTFGSFLGMKTGEGGGKTFTEWVQEVDKINSFVGKMEEGEDSLLKNYLSTLFTQLADELKMSAAKNSYEPYNGETSDVKDFLLTPNTIIELDPVLSYYCVYSPSTTTVYFDCDGAIEECSTGEFTFKNTRNLVISYDLNSGEIDNINLYKTLNASYGTFAVSSEKIEGILTSKDENGDSLLSRTLQTSRAITDMLSKYALKEDIPGESNLSGYVQTSELQRTYDSILQQVGKSTFKVYDKVKIQPNETKTVLTNLPGIYRLMGGIGIVTCRINPSLDGFTNGDLYLGTDLIIPESIGLTVEFSLTNESEDTAIVYLISDIKATLLASLKITSEEITSIVENNETFETAIQRIAAGLAQLLLSKQGTDEEGNPLDWQTAYNALVSNYESTQQQIADLNDNLLHVKQTAEGQSTMVMSGYYANILSGLVNGEDWIFTPEFGTASIIPNPTFNGTSATFPSARLSAPSAGTLVSTENLRNPNLTLTGPGNFTIYWNGFSGKTGTLTSPSFSLPFEAMPSTAGKTEEEIEVITEEYKNKNYYVLSWEGANPGCIKSISLGTDLLLIRDTETDFKKGSGNFEVVIPEYLAGYFNIVFKTTKEYKDTELLINIDITENYSKKLSNNNIYINQVKLEKGHFGKSSVRTPWTESKEDKIQITTDAITAAGKISTVEDSVSGLSSSFQQMRDSFQMTVQDKQGTIGGLTVTVNGTSFEGDVIATNFLVKPLGNIAEAPALFIGTWGSLILNSDATMQANIQSYWTTTKKITYDAAVHAAWPVMYALVGNDVHIFDFTASISGGGSGNWDGYYVANNLEFDRYDFYYIDELGTKTTLTNKSYYIPKQQQAVIDIYEEGQKVDTLTFSSLFPTELKNEMCTDIDIPKEYQGAYYAIYRNSNIGTMYYNNVALGLGNHIKLTSSEADADRYAESGTIEQALKTELYGKILYNFGKEASTSDYLICVPDTAYIIDVSYGSLTAPSLVKAAASTKLSKNSVNAIEGNYQTYEEINGYYDPPTGASRETTIYWFKLFNLNKGMLQETDKWVAAFKSSGNYLLLEIDSDLIQEYCYWCEYKEGNGGHNYKASEVKTSLMQIENSYTIVDATIKDAYKTLMSTYKNIWMQWS